ncbi:MAG: hypothetical protein IJQ68_01865 [Methanobrevibacter sp.]|uniref:hypothetical protein n=1 Tax=Methanobrevibacter sp. TaxID=66852 RepID=UPI0025DFD70A|nr:hypothetical protein [Methanobrevibacter sp.]MBR0270727.1 hypothetical protein [Methanobrevibacter sp.]
MNEKKFDETSLVLIENMFDEHRKIVGLADESIQKIAEKHQRSADIFITEHGELISYEIMTDDINNNEIDKIRKYGEDLYEINGKYISIYILGSPHMKINGIKEIVSDAPLLIKISQMPQSDAYDVLRHITDLVKRKQKLNEEDLFALSMIPQMGPKEDKRHLRIECLKLWKEITKKGLIQ